MLHNTPPFTYHPPAKTTTFNESTTCYLEGGSYSATKSRGTLRANKTQLLGYTQNISIQNSLIIY